MEDKVFSEKNDGRIAELLKQLGAHELDIFEIRIADIVVRYTASIDQKADLDTCTEFLLGATSLIQLKTRSLFPHDEAEVEIDEELQVWEQRDALISRLLAHMTFKAAARAFEYLEKEAAHSWPHPGFLEEQFRNLQPNCLVNVSPARLRDVYEAVKPKPLPTVSVTHLSQVRMTVGEAIGRLRSALPKRGRATFAALTKGYEPIEVVVAFLGVLEMHKAGTVELEQATQFGDLHVRLKKGPSSDIFGLP